jgi:hypothetical protein
MSLDKDKKYVRDAWHDECLNRNPDNPAWSPLGAFYTCSIGTEAEAWEKSARITKALIDNLAARFQGIRLLGTIIEENASANLTSCNDPLKPILERELESFDQDRWGLKVEF